MRRNYHQTHGKPRPRTPANTTQHDLKVSNVRMHVGCKFKGAS